MVDGIMAVFQCSLCASRIPMSGATSKGESAKGESAQEGEMQVQLSADAMAAQCRCECSSVQMRWQLSAS